MILDFDSARRDRRAPATLRAFEQDWSIPASRPAGLSIYMDELQEEKGETGLFTRKESYELLRLAVSEETFSGLIAAGLEEADIWPLLMDLMRLWNGDGDEGEAEAPAEGAGSDT